MVNVEASEFYEVMETWHEVVNMSSVHTTGSFGVSPPLCRSLWLHSWSTSSGTDFFSECVNFCSVFVSKPPNVCCATCVNPPFLPHMIIKGFWSGALNGKVLHFYVESLRNRSTTDVQRVASWGLCLIYMKKETLLLLKTWSTLGFWLLTPLCPFWLPVHWLWKSLSPV